MSSEGKFFNKVKNAFKNDKSNESSPQNSPRASRSSKSGSTSSDPKNVLKESKVEGEKQAVHDKQGSTSASKTDGIATAGTGADTTYGGAGNYSHSQTGHSSEHENILKEAFKEGEKLFHHHSKTGNTGVLHGGTASAGAAAGGIGGYSAGSKFDQKSTVPDYSSKGNDVVSSSSKGRVVTSPPRRSREPLSHETPGDYSNAKNPIDSSVISGGNSGYQDKGVYDNSKPAYSDGAETVQGQGKFFDPKDTQGGVLGAAVGSTSTASAYNQDKLGSSHEEATKAKYVDEDKLKTKPTAYAQEDKEREQLEQLKQEAYREGNKQGRKDVQEDPSLLGSRQIGGSGISNDQKDIDKQAVHQENKSAYNQGGVAEVLEKEHGQSTPSNKRNADHDNIIKTGGVVYGGSGVASSGRDNYDPVATDRRISDLDAQINQTDNKIKQLRSDPSNASTYAVRDEPIKTPKLSDVHDDYDHDEFKDAQTDRNTNDNAERTGVFAGAGGALAAAAGYLGFKGTQPEDKVTNDSYHQGEYIAIKEDVYNAGFKQGKDLYDPSATTTTNRTVGNSTNSGINAKDVESKAYGEGYHQGRNEQGGIIEEAKHAVEGVTAVAASYLGYGAGHDQTSTNRGVGSASTTSPEHKDILDSSYQAGKQRYENERAGHTYSNQPGQETFVERAEAIIEGATASAASYLGLESSKPHSAIEGHQQLLREAYEAGKAKGEKEKSAYGSGNTSTLDPANQRSQQQGGGVWQEAKEVASGTALAAAGAGVAATNYASDKLGYGSNNKADDDYDSHRTTSTVPTDNRVENSQKSSSNEPGYLASAGATIGGAGAAIGNALGYNQTPQQKQQDVKDSLLTDAEKVDPSIEKLPAHKTNRKELKQEETLAPKATDEEKHIVESNQLNQAEKDVDAWNKKHGFTNPKGSLIDAAEEADPSIENLPAHKTNKKELKEEKTLAPDATEEEKEIVDANQFKDMEDEVAAYNKKHGFTNTKASLIEVAEEADPKIEKLPAHKGQSVDKELANKSDSTSGADVQALPANHPTARHTEIKESLGLPTGDSSSKKSVDSGKKSVSDDSSKSKDYEESDNNNRSSSGAGIGAAVASAVGLGSGSNSDNSLDSDFKKELYQEGFEKGKLDTHTSSHKRNVSGASYNTTQPIGASEIRDKQNQSLDNTTKKEIYEHGYNKGLKEKDSQHSNHTGRDVASGGILGSLLGHNKDTENQSLDHSTKKEIYEHGYNKGLKDKESQQSNHTGRDLAAGGITGATLDHGLKKELYEHGFRKGKSDHESVGQKLEDWFKKELYEHGHKKGTEDHAPRGLYGGTASLDPVLRQQLYEHGHAHGHKVQGQQQGSSIGGSGLDSKLKQDLYEHGYAKGSTEKKQQRDDYIHNKPYGTSNKEATALGAAAGYGTSQRHQNEYGQPSERAQLDRNSELVGENTAHKRGQDTEDNLVVEVVGIEDKVEALRTARNASKKLDERGVDLTSGKLIIDANNREIYKEEYVSEREIPSQGYSGSSGAAPEVLGQSRAAGFTQGTQPNFGTTGHNDTSYRGDGVGKRTEVEPETLGQTRAAGFTQGTHQHQPNTQYEGEGVGQRTTLGAGQGNHTGSQTAGNHTNESEIAKQRLHEAARNKAGLTAGTSSTNHQGTSPSSKSTSGTKNHDDEIFVNVKGIKDNALATKIARAAVARLQKTHGSVISKVKELQVDASSGIVRDEHGNEIAKYTDLAVEAQQSSKSRSQESSPKKSTYGHSPSSSKSYGTNTGPTSSSHGATTSSALAGSGIAAAAASEASQKHPSSSLTEPTHHTSANTGNYSSKSAEPPYPQGIPATKEGHQTSGVSGIGHGRDTYDESKIHSTGHQNASTGYGNTSSTGYGNTSTTGSTSSTGNYSSSSSGLPSHQNYDNQNVTGNTRSTDGPSSSTSRGYESQQQGSTTQGGLAGLASSIVGASGVGSALESLGVTGGNKTHDNSGHEHKTSSSTYEDSTRSPISESHLSGSNAYPKSAVDAYSSSSNTTSLDNKINDASTSSYIPESGLYSKSIPSEFSSKKTSTTSRDQSGVIASEYLNKESTNLPETSHTSNTAAHNISSGVTGSGIGSTTSAARGQTATDNFDEANTSSGSFSMPGAWS
ncbi:hypothetical protein KGF54_004747 [Candida jiufengensis]|uniref:uncharacterized protein n=1 Tax=Candida jiufengensis TaxID=497108 RepID=UPI0022240350|nr:uncharacterized protein KGF54_004747 [Candida jiufengensis]KAI5951672.1 hypothetical protein KGF54_004747 [Candida jiufengensis]